MATVLKIRPENETLLVPAGAGGSLFTGIYTLWLKHMRKFFRSNLEIFGTLMTPFLWMLLFGICMDTVIRELKVSNVNLGYKNYITPGVMLLTGLTAAILGGSTLLLERINGVLKEYLVAPVPRISVLLGTLASGLTKSILQSLVVLALGIWWDPAVISRPLNLLAALGLMALFSLGFVGVAAAVACKAKGMESYHSLMVLLNLPVLFLSNALYPFEQIPVIIRVVAFCNPTTYAVDAMRSLLYGVPSEISLPLDVGVIFFFTFFGLALGYRHFKESMEVVVA